MTSIHRGNSGGGDPHIGVKEGGGDDAIHVLLDDGASFTLCGYKAASRNTIVLGADTKIDPYSGCWTCIREARFLLSDREAPDAA